MYVHVQVHTGAKLNAENGRKQRKKTSSSSLEKCVKWQAQVERRWLSKPAT